MGRILFSPLVRPILGLLSLITLLCSKLASSSCKKEDVVDLSAREHNGVTDLRRLFHARPVRRDLLFQVQRQLRVNLSLSLKRHFAQSLCLAAGGLGLERKLLQVRHACA